MRFIIDADLPRAVARVIADFDHESVDVRDIGMGASSDEQIVEYARSKGLCVLTADLGFGDVRRYPPSRTFGIVILRLPRHATTSFILGLLSSFLSREEILWKLEGKLAVVEVGRIRLRTG